MAKGLRQYFAKCGPHTTGIRVTLQLGNGKRELVKHADRLHPRPLEAGPRNLHGSRAPRMIHMCFYLSRSLGSYICFLLSLCSFFISFCVSSIACISLIMSCLKPLWKLESRVNTQALYVTRCPRNHPAPLMRLLPVKLPSKCSPHRSYPASPSLLPESSQPVPKASPSLRRVCAGKHSQWTKPCPAGLAVSSEPQTLQPSL